MDSDSKGTQGKCTVIKTSTRQVKFWSIFFCETYIFSFAFHPIQSVIVDCLLPVVGLVDPTKLKPGDLVGVNFKDMSLVLDILSQSKFQHPNPLFDDFADMIPRVKAMEADEKPTEEYADIGDWINNPELVEAIVLPMTHKERFESLGINPPEGVLYMAHPELERLYWFVHVPHKQKLVSELAGPQLVQVFFSNSEKR